MADREEPVDAREELRALRERSRMLPVLDNRTPDQILGYDDCGLPC